MQIDIWHGDWGLVEVPKVSSYLSPYVRKCWMDDMNNDEDDKDEPAPILPTPTLKSIKSPNEKSFTGEVDDAE